MKRIIFTASLMLLAIVSVQAQEKGSYLTISGSLGMNQFRYEMDNGRMGDPRLGYGGALGYQYFWNRHWGLGTGVGISYYSTRAKYSNSWYNESRNDINHYQFDGRVDDDWIPGSPQNYSLQLSLNNWVEKQYAYFLEVPLMLYYQTKWGEKQAVGMYWGLGAKVQFPVIYSKYEVGRSSELAVQGYYPDADLTIDGGHIDGKINNLHGYGTAKDLGYKDDLDIKMSFAAVGEIGMLIALNRRVDLTLGGYLDVGLNNIKDGNKSERPGANLIEPGAEKDAEFHKLPVGETMQYNGIINSNVTDDVKLLGVGGKIGLRIKLGKLTEKKVEEEQPEKEEMIVVQEVIKEPEPVVEVKPVKAEGVNQADLNVLSEPIFFDLAKHDLRPDAIQALDRKLAILKQYPDVKVVIAGNTCDLGGDKVNVPLGQRRADAARDYLERNGINGSRMETITQSSNYPMLPNTNEQNRTKNRRDDFKPSGY
jgi:outer membrane protein OmpA-like peptidoglycan-associated protein